MTKKNEPGQAQPFDIKGNDELAAIRRVNGELELLLAVYRHSLEKLQAENVRLKELVKNSADYVSFFRAEHEQMEEMLEEMRRKMNDTLKGGVEIVGGPLFPGFEEISAKALLHDCRDLYGGISQK